MGKGFRGFLERLRAKYRSLDFTLARRFGLATREDRLFFLLIPLTGVLAGVLGLLVSAGTKGLQDLLWGHAQSLLAAATRATWWRKLVALGVGGVLIGLIVWLGRSSVRGHGTSSLIESVALKNGRVEPRPVLLTALAGVATVGSGGSLGREGPMIGLGAMVSSWLGSRFGLAPQRVKILLGCGAAAGMAAIYNTPIGGALFAMEVILGNFALEIFGPIVVSSVISTVIARSFRGPAPIYATPDYALVSGWELLAYTGLGLVGALASVLFIFATHGADRSFARLRLPAAVQPLLGLLLVGALGIYVPYVYGNGFETITLALHDHLPLVLLLTLPLYKLLATALTAGSGGAGAGGMFTPSLFVGSLVGGAYGHWIHALWPASTATSGAYAAVGMAAIAAGTSHAPISAILILFEFTGNYDLILPLMLASIVSSLAASALYPYSIYTASLQGRGPGPSRPRGPPSRRRLPPGGRPFLERAAAAALRGLLGPPPPGGDLAPRHQVRPGEPGEPDRGRGARPDAPGDPGDPPGRASPPCHRGLRGERFRASAGGRQGGQIPRRARQARPARGLRPGGAGEARPPRHLRLQQGLAAQPRLRGAAARLLAPHGAVAARVGGQDPCRGPPAADGGSAGDRDQAPERRPGDPDRRHPVRRRSHGDGIALAPGPYGGGPTEPGQGSHAGRGPQERPMTEDPEDPLTRLGASAGLCATCVHREIKASARSVFLRCRLADVDPRFLRYPPLPVWACPGWEREG